MRKKILILFIIGLVGFSFNAIAQGEINFTYDEAGNLTKREIIHLSFSPVTTNDQDTTDLPGDTHKDFFEDNIGKQNIKIFPNPTKGQLTIQIENYSFNSQDKIEIYNMQGVLKNRISPITSSNTIHIHEYPQATYIMVIHINGESHEWKIIKE